MANPHPLTTKEKLDTGATTIGTHSPLMLLMTSELLWRKAPSVEEEEEVEESISVAFRPWPCRQVETGTRDLPLHPADMHRADRRSLPGKSSRTSSGASWPLCLATSASASSSWDTSSSGQSHSNTSRDQKRGKSSST